MLVAVIWVKTVLSTFSYSNSLSLRPCLSLGFKKPYSVA